MDLRHYDNVSHTLSASYEDVQEGMSTPYGISRTSTLTFIPQTGYSGRKNFANCAKELTGMGVLLPTPEYLHKQKAFGIWSLPDRSTAFRTCVEEYLDAYIDFYKKAIEQNKWYGFGIMVMLCILMITIVILGDMMLEVLLGIIRS